METSIWEVNKGKRKVTGTKQDLKLINNDDEGEEGEEEEEETEEV